MSRFRKVIVAAGVLGIGICASIPFYRADDDDSPEQVTTSGNSFPWRNNGAVSLDVQAKQTSGRAPKDRSALVSSPPSARPPRVEQAKSSAAEIEMKQSPADGLAGDQGSGPPLAPTRVTHVVIDGDTLPDLAEQYLGDRTRYLEIYRANPQLSSPTALPINVQIVIPPPSAKSEAPAATKEPLD